MGRMIEPSQRLLAYLTEYGGREAPAQLRCREETQRRANAVMQIAPEQAAALALLAQLTGARRCIEVGVFTGYSALAVALALPQARIVALDVSEEFTSKARVYWAEAGVADRIDLRLGPAEASLDAMIARQEGPFDFAFIDADKTGYDAYYERCLALLRPGGLIALDNMLYSGEVADPAVREAAPAAVRALNAKIKDDSRVDMALTTIGDGMMLARKR